MPSLSGVLFLLIAALDAQPTVQEVINGGSGDARFCAGLLVVISGHGFGSGASGTVTITVGGKLAAVNGAVYPDQIPAQLPVDLPIGPTTLTVTVQGRTSPPFNLTIDAYAPAFLNGGGGVFYDPLGGFPGVFSSAHPATPGTQVTAYLVGLGATNPVVPTGVSGAKPAPTVVPPHITVGGKMAEVRSAGLIGLPGIYSVNFILPVDLAAGDQDVVLEIGGKLTPKQTLPTSTLLPVVIGLRNAGNGQLKDATHGAAPNGYVTIYASGIGANNSTGNLFPATSFQGIQVLFNGTPAPLYNVIPAAGLINLVVPSELPETGTTTITVRNSVGLGENISLTMAPLDVGVFRLPGPANQKPNNGAVQFANTAWIVMPTSVATAYGFQPCTGLPVATACAQPAKVGDSIVIYFAGGGKATPNGDLSGKPVATGSIAPVDGSVIYKTVVTPKITIGGIDAQALFSGVAPGTAAEYQINTVIPAGVQPGDDVQVRITFDSNSDTFTIAVR